jgi:hypothetical protein
MHGYTNTIREQHLDWAEKLVADPATGKNRASEIPPLTAAQHDQIVKTHDEYNQLVAEDRSNDGGG